MRSFYLAILFGSLSYGHADLMMAEDAAHTEETLLEETLLEDLGAELLQPAVRQPSEPKTPAPLDERLLEELGEDLTERSAAQDDWLSKVVKHMQTAHTRLEQSDESASASSAQAEALTGIDAMIAELTERQSQCKGGQCKGGQCDKPGTPKPGKKPGSSGKAGKSPASSAPTTTNSGADLSTELAVAGELVKDLWGQLPERQREQILQPLSEEFLPKYASEIEAYFRALAEPDQNSQAPQ